MNKSVVTLLLIIIGIPLLAVAFPNFGRESPTYYDIPKEYVAFPADSKFNFGNLNINYSYFFREYKLDIERLVPPLSRGEMALVEDTHTAFEKMSAKATPVYDKKNIRYLGYSTNGQHVYETHIYLHVSVYVSYPISFLNKKNKYLIDLGTSKLFTDIPPEEYKTIAPQLEME